MSLNRSFTSTAPYNTDFYSYTTIKVGMSVMHNLGPVSGANASNCPAGRILTENGTQLNPGTNQNVSQPMVGVVDSISGLSGYIVTNSSVFMLNA